MRDVRQRDPLPAHRGRPGQDATVVEAVPAVVLGEPPNRLHRMLASIRRVLAIG